MTIRDRFKVLTLILAVTFVIPAHAERQERDGDVYMVGHCYTPTQAAKLLNDFSKTHHDRGTWEARRATIRQNILDGAQLSSIPKHRKAPAVIRHSKKQMVGYTVENIAIETLPGLWLCGNLYLPNDYDPNDASVSVPGVLCPHGHKKDKRFDEQVQARSAAFARMGAAVFAYDMIGHGETKQLEHKTAKTLRLHTWNSIRALDYLAALPGIDNDRLAITGGSGGGTQTFVLSAIDERIDLSMPAVMVSSYFFGGCGCESGMPIHVRGDFETNNVEIAAAFAPKPLLLISNGKDWTQHNPTLAYPYIKDIYSYYAAENKIENAHLQDEGHDYGPNKRAAAYRFIAKHFDLDIASIQDSQGKIDESWFELLGTEQLRVLNDDHALPDNALTQSQQAHEQLDAIMKNQ
ncbi:MAG: acetylxylan esterase [Phycisphaeraceae bacterium]